MKESAIDLIKETPVLDNSLILNWIGQSGFVIKSKMGIVLCIDPYYSNSIVRYEGHECKRIWDNTFKIEFFHPDVTILTHDHLDHTDPETLPLIAAYSECDFYGPISSCKHLELMNIDVRRIKTMELNSTYYKEDVAWTAIYAKHTQDSLGILVEICGVKIYFTGDTSDDLKLRDVEKFNPDILIPCVNGLYGNLNVKEAVKLAKDLNVQLTIPMHYGLISNNTIDINNFVVECNNENIAYQILVPENNYIIQKSNGKIIIGDQQ